MINYSYLQQADIDRIIKAALEEDLGADGDVTTNSVVPKDAQAVAKLMAKAEGVLAGLDFFFRVFKTVDPSLRCSANMGDGARLKYGDIICTISGNAQSLLIAERTALNLLCRLSGIATKTAVYVKETEGTNAKVLDTRKTTPGLRTVEKYAVAVGGGTNHRIGLFDAILIKENHIAMGGGVVQAVKSARAASDFPVQIEVTTLDELRQAIEIGADSILIDNFTAEQTAEAVKLARSIGSEKLLLESSGGITIDTLRQYAETGVDRISMGTLTHSVEALDMSLEITAK
jgi:nicotinate-nucleotide pyrophosphorylase (carboxylating)